jgi:hypothetical protein
MCRFIIICLLSIIVASCSQDDNKLESKDGDWGDVIKLSKHEVFFEADDSSQTVVSEGLWWLSYVENLQTSISYPGVGDINTTGNLGTYEWLNIEKMDNKTLQIKVERNAGTIRKMRIAVTCGDFFDYIVVTQKGFN